MIAPAEHGANGGKRRTLNAERRTSKAAEATEQRERELHICVEAAPEKVELRYFRTSRDPEGVTIRLSREAAQKLAVALLSPGVHFVMRDDGHGAEERANG
jgi:hypothetical protein